MDKMVELTAREVQKLDELLQEYIDTVENSLMTPSSQRTYIDQAQMFVRWVKGDFEPGERLYND